MNESNNLYFSTYLRNSMLSYAKNAKIISVILLVLSAFGIVTILGSFFLVSIFKWQDVGGPESAIFSIAAIIYLALILAYVYLIYLLYSHSNLLISAIQTEDQAKVELAFDNLAIFFKLILYYFIAVVVLYIILMVVFFIFASQVGGDMGLPI